MPHKTTTELQKLSQALAKQLRRQENVSDEMYQLFTLFHARLKLVEEAIENWTPIFQRLDYWEQVRNATDTYRERVQGTFQVDSLE